MAWIVLIVGLIITCLSGYFLFKPAHIPTTTVTRTEIDSWRFIILVLLLIDCAISLIITYAADDSLNTTVGYLFRILKLSNGADSWNPMTTAIDHMRHHPSIPVYSEIFFKDQIKFQYPLSSLVFIDLFQRITHIPWTTIFRILNCISLACLPLIGLTSYFLFANVIDSRNRPNTFSRHPTLLIIFVISTLFFYPITRSYGLGQIQTWITLLVAGALLAWQNNRRGVSGLMLGVCCIIKPQWMIVVVWGCIRKQWGFSAACASVFGLITLVAWLLYGTQNLLDYSSALTYMSHHGESYFGNQSINGMANRFLFNGNNLLWDEHNFPPYEPRVYFLTILSAGVIIGSAVFWRLDKSPSTIDLALITLSLTIASPIAWKHHYGVLFPILAVLMPIAIYCKPFGKLTNAYLLLSYILISQQLDEVFNSTAPTHFNFLQSYLFWGGLMVLMMLLRVSSQLVDSKSLSSLVMSKPTLSGQVSV